MNYDRIIIELLDRVAALEQEVEKLKGGWKEPFFSSNEQTSAFPQLKSESYTDRACGAIEKAIEVAKVEGKPYIDIVSLDIQHIVGGRDRSPSCCNAMRKVAKKYKTEVIKDTASHNSSTYTIRYFL